MQNAVTLANKPLPAVEARNPSDEHHSDEQLLARIAAGDRGTLATLYARHHVRLYRFLLRLVNNTAAAEDLTSEVFLEIWKHAHRFEGRSQVSTWMLSIARHRAMSALRRRADEPLDETAAAEIADTADGPEAILLKQRQASALRKCLARLSPAHREIIDLVYYHAKSIAEVAEIIGAPQNTVKTRMFYARKKLAEALAADELNAAA
jgi:RNA polymerase sigma-70 factor (ECF subfamily)